MSSTLPPEPAGPAPGPNVVPAPVPIPTSGPPELWTKDDLPTLGWCIGKGIAKFVVMLFISVLVPLELLSTIFGPGVLPIQFPLSLNLLIYGGSAVAFFSGASTATQTTRVYGLFKFLSSAVKLIYLFLLALVGIIVVDASFLAITFGFRVLIYLFMIGTALAALSALVTLYEDYKHPGDRLPFDFPLSRRELRARQDAYNRSIQMGPEP